MNALSGFSTAAIRYAVGYIFVLAGLLKWLIDEYGFIRFEHIGMPFPHVSVLLVGSVEIIFGSLLLFNLHVKNATVPLLFIMAGAICITKIPIWIESGFLKFAIDSRLDVILIVLLVILFKEYKESAS